MRASRTRARLAAAVPLLLHLLAPDLRPPVPSAGAAVAELELVGRLTGATPALAVAVAGDLAAVAAHGRGVHLVDVADPSRPRLLATAPTTGPAYDVALDGARLYVAAWTGGLEVVDIAAPAAPRRLGRAATRSNARSVAVLGVPGRQLVVTGSWSALDFEGGDPELGLEVFDVADPAAPKRVGELATPGWDGDLAADGALVFVADGPGGVRAVDLTDPASARELGALPTSVRAYGVALGRGPDGRRRLHVADNAGGYLLVDAEFPSAMRVLGAYATEGAAYAVADAGPVGAWVAEAMGGDPSATGRVSLLDLTSPERPRLLGMRDTDRRAWGLAVGEGGLAFAAVTEAGLWALAPASRPVGTVWLPWLN